MASDLVMSGSLSPDEVRRKVAEFEWYHRIDLGNGIVTPGQFDLAPLLPHYGIPASLEGKSVLDVGPGHGFFAFEFERRRARRIVTSELPDWTEHDSSPDEKAALTSAREQGEAYHRGAFGFAIQARGSRLERRFCNIYDLSPERVGTFDLVFCASVLLHLTDPLRAMYALRRVCTGQAIVSTAVEWRWPLTSLALARFVARPGGHVFWLPTTKCLMRMALAAGFERCERVSTFRLRSADGTFDVPHATIRAFV
jgi:SAM-dependent methyltransferase